MSEPQACQSKELLVTVLYGEASADEHASLQRHLAACESCRDEFEALGGVRRALQEWEAPQLRANFRIVSDAVEPVEPRTARLLTGPTRWWTSRSAGRAGLAAAAMLVVGVSAGLANLDVTIGPDGLRVRTGRHQPAGTPGGASTTLEGGAGAFEVQTAGAPAPAAAGAAAPWQADLTALEQRFRREMATRAIPPAATPGATSTRSEDEALLRRVQALIEQAETRQQRNLALRVTELARDFDMQRKADFVQFQQGLGKIEGRAEAEAVRTQQMMNYLVRTASTTPR